MAEVRCSGARQRGARARVQGTPTHLLGDVLHLLLEAVVRSRGNMLGGPAYCELEQHDVGAPSNQKKNRRNDELGLARRAHCGWLANEQPDCAIEGVQVLLPYRERLVVRPVAVHLGQSQRARAPIRSTRHQAVARRPTTARRTASHSCRVSTCGGRSSQSQGTAVSVVLRVLSAHDSGQGRCVVGPPCVSVMSVTRGGSR
jgi:hypothetical protein